jgi:GxxExxY protein
VDLPIDYKGYRIDSGYRLDLVVDHSVVVELKAVRQLERIHEAQLLTYLKLTGLNLGLLLNFNVVLLKDGIKRLVNGLKLCVLRVSAVILKTWLITKIP